MLAINHLAWVDIPVVGAQSPRNINYVAKVEMTAGSRFRRRSSAGTGSSPSGAASPTATPCGRCSSTRAPAARSALFVEGTRQKADEAPGPSPAGRRDGRDPGRGAGRADRRLRDAVLEAVQLRAVLDRDRRAVPVEGVPRGGKGYKEASVEIERRLNVLFDWLADVHAAGPARGADPAAVSANDGVDAARHGCDRRLPERRQVDADQPAHLVARRRRARDERDDARPQGARLRVGGEAVPARRHRRRRRREQGRRSRARSSSRRSRRSPRPTSCCSWSTRAPA